MKSLRILIAFAVVAGASAMPLVSSATAATAATATTADAASGVVVDLVAGAAGVYTPGTDLTVSARISNETAAALPQGTASVYVDPQPVASRAELSEWLRPSDASTVESLGGAALVEVATPAVAAGGAGSLPPAVTVPAASVAVGTAFGVHRVSVTVIAGDTRVVGRSAIVVDPGTGTPSTRLAVAIPLAPPVETPGVIPVELLESYTAPGGRLDRVLQQTEGTPVALGIDPRIIASINLLGDSAPPSVIAWRERLRSVANETFPLAYADSDIAATSQVAGAVLSPVAFDVDPGLFPAESDAASQPPTPSPGVVDPPDLPTTESLLAWDYSSSSIAWPYDDSVVAADLDTFEASGLTTTILSSTNTTAGSLERTPSASAQVAGREVLTSDAVISGLLRDAVSASTPTGTQSALAGLTASLAAVAAEAKPGQVVLATLGRDSAAGFFALASTLAAVNAPSWTTLAPLSAAMERPPVDVSVVDRPVAAERTAAVSSMLASEATVAQFANVVEDPTVLTGERRLSLLALTAQEWAATPEDWQPAVADYLGGSEDILGSVVVASTEFQQFSDNRPLPIVVTNALDYPVTVNVTVTSLGGILLIDQPVVELTIPAGSQERASVPAQSIANGRVTLQIALSSVTGVPVGAPSTIDVTVNAGWETAVTTVLAAIVVAVFVFGIIRTARRRSTRRDTTDSAVSEHPTARSTP